MPTPRPRLLLTLLLAGLGCGGTAEAPHGSPVLLEVVWTVEGFTQQVWGRDRDAAVPATAPASPEKISFVFDRRLDGARIEDTVDGNPVPKPDPPITVSWPEMATTMSNPPFAADVFYNTLPEFGPGTTYTFVRPHIPGFPSATAITFSLDPNGLTSLYGEPMDGPPTITVTTDPLSVRLPSSTATVPLNYQAAMEFSTRAGPPSAVMPFVHVSASGVALPFNLVPDLGNAKRMYVVPTCADGWPSNVRVEITADVGLPDGFGRPLAAAAKGSFMTSRIAAPPVDGACGPFDAGAIDAAPADASPDDGSTSDASPDAGAPDGP